jgi:hypothetical protein
MGGHHVRNILNAITRFHSSLAIINILEPNRVKTFVETSQAGPNVSTGHQESTGRLVDFSRAVEIPIQITIPAIDRVGRP